ncbi:Neuropeptide-Like Protein [Caenorhabditis elegans]|uniref:Neuropeptide-Like Protein n=1 Tax=Caenorhabditis elegans TaxID=6239 RepID=O62455_CAEEL|nr:Neuropeptide-Like Protein [Caenorhabditis elegans]CAA16362.1 Neuropeptide-Like Protein [Caenorhabditis elegans]|eukprot:NP_502603.1 Neuropeptide-Like Protein [Caenorhabditis elegans]
MFSKSILFCLLVLVFNVFGANFENDQDVMRPPFQALKRGSLSNMMRIGKRQMSRQQEYVQFPNEGVVPCESCNLGTLMRIGRR